jgi:hypothetical protein
VRSSPVGARRLRVRLGRRESISATGTIRTAVVSITASESTTADPVTIERKRLAIELALESQRTSCCLPAV